MQRPFEVAIPGGGSSTYDAARRLPRPLSVDAALQFSPMTSAPIFGLDSILRPDIEQPSLANWARTYDSHTAGRLVDTLDNETQASSTDSSYIESVRKNIHNLLIGEGLVGDGLTKIQFKVPPRISQPRPSQKTQTPPANMEFTAHERLGPFAKMVLDTTNVPYRYPSPSSPSPLKQAPRLKPYPVPDQQDRNIRDNGNKVVSKNQLPGVSVKPVIMLPAFPDPSQLSEYQHIPEMSKRRPRSPSTQQTESVKLRDQREVINTAVANLQSLLQDVFESEDELQLESSQDQEQNANKYFYTMDATEDSKPCLSSDAHKQLQKAFRSVSGYGKLGDIPNEFITRVQKLCEAPIMAVQSVDITTESDMSDTSLENWAKLLGGLENALLAMGTLLHTMDGRTDAKELCSEDMIQLIPTALNHVFEHCIIPAVECRPNGKDAAIFSLYSGQKQAILSLTQQSRKVLSQLGIFLSAVDLVEGAITAMEFMATKLIFVENAHHEKESTIGIQKFEAVRRCAMDMLAKIFAKYAEQRSFILDEILVSLEKLPSTRQNARQFKLTDGKSIQLLSALVVQLVQTTALRGSSQNATKSKLWPSRRNNNSSDDDGSGSEDEDDTLPFISLSKQVDQAYDNAVRSAQYITRFIVQRAMTSTKTGDQPYRNILDLFTEDLISILGSSEWPGVELLLRVLASQMVGIAEHDKSTANAKNMALELLGWMGSAISDLTSTAQHLNNSTDEGDSELTEYIRQLFDNHIGRSLHVQDLVVRDGPYRIALEYLNTKDVAGSHLPSARDYLLTAWAKTACTVHCESAQNAQNEALSRDSSVRKLAISLKSLISDPQWLEQHREFETISAQQARFAYLIVILSSGFCKAFDTIVKVLLSSISSDQAKVRSRSLKSVIHMLERDPSLLDRDDSIMDLILRCAADSSPMVRDSALTLTARCISLKPALENECCRAILACASDPTVGVRKRCIGLMKDVYAATSNKELRISVIEHVLKRVQDHETNVATLARQALEELWLSPLHATDGFDTPQAKVALEELVALFIGAVQRGDEVVANLESFFKTVLHSESKSVSQNFRICKAAVATLFENVVHGSNADQRSLQSHLRTLTVFAKSNARLLTPGQLETLHPYIGHLSSTDDLLLFRSVVVIYRCVLPHLSSAHNNLLKDIQNDLFKSVSKLARTELNEVMACLWTINGVLQNTERLVKLTISVLKGIYQASNTKLDASTSADALGRVRSYIRIAGCVGKHCDLEKYTSFFTQAFPKSNTESVSGLMVEFIAPFASSTYPHELRIMALESLGSVCETWPEQYGKEKARIAFSSVFEEDNGDLQDIVLKTFLTFFSIHEGKSEKFINTAESNGENTDTSRLGGSLKASANDGAAALIAQNFLPQMLHAAMSKQDSFALTAIELIASINRQGLIHPKECAGVLVSLETSPNSTIANTAYEIHKMLHQQHESMFDREYMRAIQDAFYYQRDVIGDSSGASARPFAPKLALLFDIIKLSNSKYQKKFLTNFCSKANFELKKLDSSGTPPEYLELTRFVCQNVAFFDYAQVAELLAAISCMERIVGTTGTAVAHSIETELLSVKVAGVVEQPEGGPNNMPPLIDSAVLKRLATAAAGLSMLWETRSYLRRLYNLNFHALQKEGKVAIKELNKPASKVPGISGDRFWEAVARIMKSLDNAESMTNVCREFSTLMSVDDELKIAGDEDRGSPDPFADVNDMSNVIGATTRPGKRKSSISGATTPKKRARGRPKLGSKRPSDGSEEETDID
ncbi:Sister chromatid cohesion protein 2 [Microsporum audouinii]